MHNTVQWVYQWVSHLAQWAWHAVIKSSCSVGVAVGKSFTVSICTYNMASFKMQQSLQGHKKWSLLRYDLSFAKHFPFCGQSALYMDFVIKHLDLHSFCVANLVFPEWPMSSLYLLAQTSSICVYKPPISFNITKLRLNFHRLNGKVLTQENPSGNDTLFTCTCSRSGTWNLDELGVNAVDLTRLNTAWLVSPVTKTWLPVSSQKSPIFHIYRLGCQLLVSEIICILQLPSGLWSGLSNYCCLDMCILIKLLALNWACLGCGVCLTHWLTVHGVTLMLSSSDLRTARSEER